MNIRPKEARRIFSSLRIGIPPQKGIQHYTTDELSKFLKRFVREADYDIEDSSIIKFIYGDYGSGKTHFLRLQKEA
jgi:chromosomal replication initiation ATPase DnaA